jgi:hypothetical protein
VKFLDGGRTREAPGIYMDLVDTTRNRIPPSISLSGKYERGFSNSTQVYQIWSTTNFSVGDQLWILHCMCWVVRPFVDFSKIILIGADDYYFSSFSLKKHKKRMTCLCPISKISSSVLMTFTVLSALLVLYSDSYRVLGLIWIPWIVETIED